MVEVQEAVLVEEPFTELAPEAFKAGEIVIGTVVEINPQGQPMIVYPGSGRQEALPALTTQPVTHQHLGRQVALLFREGDPSKPVIMGTIYQPLTALLDDFEQKDQQKAAEVAEDREGSTCAYVDGEKVVIEGSKEIVLKCGEASITLTAAGKVLVKGKYVLSRSSGVNRIQGGSVQVN